MFLTFNLISGSLGLNLETAQAVGSVVSLTVIFFVLSPYTMAVLTLCHVFEVCGHLDVAFNPYVALTLCILECIMCN